MESIDALESSLSTNETLVACAIAAVVLGLVLEYGPRIFPFGQGALIWHYERRWQFSSCSELLESLDYTLDRRK